MADTHTEADQRLITAAEEMLAHHRGELELESRKLESDLEQRIKHTLEMSKHKVFVEGYDDIIRELLGVI
ncbi:MAG: hypothetical protein EBR82_80375, partial [Caulobacteraceae bacterium]|nr:hypothetical protein [Caulobacteraceae bacterium]